MTKRKCLRVLNNRFCHSCYAMGNVLKAGKPIGPMAHIKWLQSLKLEGVLQDTLDEYFVTYEYLNDKIERLDRKIEELASG